jgi:hypothetical protein
MPRRPRAHELEELSRIQLRSIFSQCGWVVWDLHPDYGEDLFVRIFAHEMATPYSFFVQAKATDHIEDYIQKDGQYLTYPIRIDHLEHWGQFWEPVILTIWDAQTNTTYWQIIQDFLQKEERKKLKRKSLNVRIPLKNVLDAHGLSRIFQRTRTRFERFNILAEGMRELVRTLEEHFDVQVKYDSELPTWTVKYSRDTYNVILPGELYEALVTGASTKNMDVNVYFNKIIKESLMLDAYFSGKAYEQWTDQGSVVIKLKNTESEYFKISFDTYEEWEKKKQEWTERKS